MNNKSIILSSPRVQMILNERKIQIRRAIDPQPTITDKGDWQWRRFRWFSLPWRDMRGNVWNCSSIPFPTETLTAYAKYQPGDILRVRETWAEVKRGCVNPNSDPYETVYVYRADGDTVQAAYVHARRGKPDVFDFATGIKWRPAIYMPREAARTFLRVTDVRAERLQDITPEDAWAEGYKHITAFERSWDKRYIDRGYGWGANPWVWVYSFERMVEP